MKTRHVFAFIVALILATFSPGAETTRVSAASFFKYDPLSVPEDQDTVVLDLFVVKEKPEPAFPDRVQKAMIDRFGRKTDDGVDEGKIGKATIIADMGDDTFIGNLAASASELKKLRGGFDFRLGNTTTTIYVRSGIAWHVGGDPNKTFTLRASGKSLIRYEYKGYDIGDLWMNGVWTPVKKSFIRAFDF